MYDTILVPVDGSEHADEAARHAKVLAEQFGSSVHLLYVADERLSVAAVSAANELRSVGEDVLDETVERASLDDGSVDVTTDVVVGVPATAITEYAEDVAADLVVMGTHGRTGLEHFLMGSTTENVIRTAATPVLTLRAD